MSDRPNDTTMLVPAASPAPRTWFGWVFAVLLLALSPVLVAGAFFGGYLNDDHAALTANPLAQPGDVPQALGQVFTPVADIGESPRAYAPLTQVTLGLQYRLSSEFPWTFRLINLLFHLGSAWLLYLIILHVLPKGAPLCAAEEPINADAQFNTSRRVVAAFGALFFFLHPLAVSAVSVIAHRGVTQAVFLALLSWWLMVRRGADRRVWRRLRRPSWGGYALSLLCFVAACLSHPLACGFGGLLIMTELFWVRSTAAGHGTRTSGWVIATVAAIGLSYLAGVWPASLGATLGADTPPLLMVALGRAVLSILAPTGLSTVYAAVELDGMGDPRIWIALGLVVAAIVILAWLPVGRPAWMLAGGGVLVLLPTLFAAPDLVTVGDWALYLSMPVGGVLFGLGAEAVQYRLRFIGQDGGKIGETVGFGLAVFLFLLLSLLSLARTFAYRSEESLLRDAVTRQPHSYMANLRLAEEFGRQARAAGMPPEAALARWDEARECIEALRFAVVDRRYFDQPARQYLLEGELDFRMGRNGAEEKIRLARKMLTGDQSLLARANRLLAEIEASKTVNNPSGSPVSQAPAPLDP